MKGLIFICVFFIGIAISQASHPKCLEGTLFFPHENDCTKYYACDSDHNALVQTCEAGLHFNPTLLICDWPENAGCTGGENPEPTLPPGSTTHKPDEYPKECPAEDNPDHPVNLPHPTECTKYYQCVDGKPMLSECPDGLHWNIPQNYCDFPETANCHRPLPPKF